MSRSNGDAVPGVNAHGIKILYGTDDDDIVIEIPHHLQFELFPSEDGLFDQNLSDHAPFKPTGGYLFELFNVIGHSTSRSTEGEAGPNDQGKSDLLRYLEGFFQRIGEPALGEIETDLLHRFLEKVSILSFLNGFILSPDHLNAIFLKDPGFIEGHGDVETGLASQGWEKGIRSLPGNDLLQYFRSDRLDIGSIGHLRIGHDRGRVGVDQDHLKPFFLQSLTGLSARVVKLAGLTDHNRPGADDQDPFDIRPFRHRFL